MSNVGAQAPPFEGESPAERRDRDVERHALNELFSLARRYRSSKAYQELLEFVGRFRLYASFTNLR
jgi:hypothetical protein